MLITWIGDQAFAANHVARYAMLTVKLVGYEYRLVRARPRIMQMRANYPDVRLDINGNPRVH